MITNACPQHTGSLGEDTDTLPKIYIKSDDDIKKEKRKKGGEWPLPGVFHLSRAFRQGLVGNVVFDYLEREAGRQRKHTEEQQQGVEGFGQEFVSNVKKKR